jgi:hypothetical protein
MAAGTPTRLYSSERRLALIGSYRERARVGRRTGAHKSYMRQGLGIRPDRRKLASLAAAVVQA